MFKEQSARGIIDGVDTSKWAEEQARENFCKAVWEL